MTGIRTNQLYSADSASRSPAHTAAGTLISPKHLRRGGPFAAVETGPNGIKRFARSYGAHRSRRFQS